MRLYELARELNYTLAELSEMKGKFGLLYDHAFSVVPEVIVEKIRKGCKKRAANESLVRQKPKVKRPAKKKIAPKLKKPTSEGADGDLEGHGDDEATDSSFEVLTAEEFAAQQEEQEARDGESTDGNKPGDGGRPTSTTSQQQTPRLRTGETSLNLGRLKEGEHSNEFEVGRIVAQAPLAAKPAKKKRKKTVVDPVERESDWNHKFANFNQQLLPKKVQLETRGSKLQRMQLVYGHELPEKKRVRQDEEKRTKSEGGNTISLPINIRDLSEKIGVKATDVIKHLMGQGVFLTITSVLDKPTAEGIALHFEKDVEFVSEKEVVEVISDIVQISKDGSVDAKLEPRPPVITIMGHVDHGKTSLLDKIRSSNLAAAESGGITQHIGGYQVVKNGHALTFLDTPGHAAFTSMRARGAQVTDIVVLVVAADDGKMPQTEEAINHAKAANVPIIVAVNKMDLQGANPKRVKEQLATLGLIPEEWSGTTPYIPVSAKTGQGIDDLLEMILLQAEQMELKAHYECLGSGIVIEAHLETGKGVIASVLVREGFFRKGDPILCGLGQGWLRQIEDENGVVLQEAGPSKIVQIMGLPECPVPGDLINVMPNIKKAKELADERKSKARERNIQEKQTMSLENLMEKLGASQVKMCNLLIKGDVQGSVEALDFALKDLGNSEVKINIIHKGVGAVSESDILLAKASSARVMAFRVSADSKAKRIANDEGVEIKNYNIIYELIDDVKNTLEGLLDPDKVESIVGEVEVRQVFRISNVGIIAGSFVKSGYVERNMPVRLIRDGKVVYVGKVQALRRFKDDVKRVEQRYECGIRLENFDDIRTNDIIETFVVDTVKKKLEETT